MTYKELRTLAGVVNVGWVVLCLFSRLPWRTVNRWFAVNDVGYAVLCVSLPALAVLCEAFVPRDSRRGLRIVVATAWTLVWCPMMEEVALGGLFSLLFWVVIWTGGISVVLVVLPAMRRVFARWLPSDGPQPEARGFEVSPKEDDARGG